MGPDRPFSEFVLGILAQKAQGFSPISGLGDGWETFLGWVAGLLVVACCEVTGFKQRYTLWGCLGGGPSGYKGIMEPPMKAHFVLLRDFVSVLNWLRLSEMHFCFACHHAM